MMAVIRGSSIQHLKQIRRTDQWLSMAPLLLAGLAAGLVFGAGRLEAQAPNPSSGTNPFWGSITAHPATAETLQLSLDEAVKRGLENNLGLKQAEASQKALDGAKLEAAQAFLPLIQLSGGTGVYQHNLAALGFSKNVFSKLGSFFPGGVVPPGLSTITRDDLTQGQLQVSQTLFSGAVFAGYKAAGAADRAANFARMSARGEVVQQVATAYLHALAAASEVDNASALENSDQTIFKNAHEGHVAGTLSNLDELRARVQLQSQQQALIAAQNTLEKDLILLKREIGIAPGQKVALTDPTPSGELETQTPEDVRNIAYKNRQDYQNLLNQAVEYKAIHAAYRSYRLPTLSFGGYWGVSTVNDAGTHGNFVAQGSLTIPLFREAKLRGDTEVAEAQVDSVIAQLDDLRTHIEQQVRVALLDVDASRQLVTVARSNVELATRTVADETDRVSAGVDDNLPLVEAQSSLASAESNLIESLYQYNLAKLALARASGVLETQYRVYLGK
jgi:outer membrane protein TolC